jgi:hypothetical protein
MFSRRVFPAERPIARKLPVDSLLWRISPDEFGVGAKRKFVRQKPGADPIALKMISFFVNLPGGRRDERPSVGTLANRTKSTSGSDLSERLERNTSWSANIACPRRSPPPA